MQHTDELLNRQYAVLASQLQALLTESVPGAHMQHQHLPHHNAQAPDRLPFHDGTTLHAAPVNTGKRSIWHAVDSGALYPPRPAVSARFDQQALYHGASKGDGDLAHTDHHSMRDQGWSNPPWPQHSLAGGGWWSSGADGQHRASMGDAAASHRRSASHEHSDSLAGLPGAAPALVATADTTLPSHSLWPQPEASALIHAATLQAWPSASAATVVPTSPPRPGSMVARQYASQARQESRSSSTGGDDDTTQDTAWLGSATAAKAAAAQQFKPAGQRGSAAAAAAQQSEPAEVWHSATVVAKEVDAELEIAHDGCHPAVAHRGRQAGMDGLSMQARSLAVSTQAYTPAMPLSSGGSSPSALRSVAAGNWQLASQALQVSSPALRSRRASGTSNIGGTSSVGGPAVGTPADQCHMQQQQGAGAGTLRQPPASLPLPPQLLRQPQAERRPLPQLPSFRRSTSASGPQGFMLQALQDEEAWRSGSASLQQPQAMISSLPTPSAPALLPGQGPAMPHHTATRAGPQPCLAAEAPLRFGQHLPAAAYPAPVFESVTAWAAGMPAAAVVAVEPPASLPGSLASGATVVPQETAASAEGQYTPGMSAQGEFQYVFVAPVAAVDAPAGLPAFKCILTDAAIYCKPVHMLASCQRTLPSPHPWPRRCFPSAGDHSSTSECIARCSRGHGLQRLCRQHRWWWPQLQQQQRRQWQPQRYRQWK